MEFSYSSITAFFTFEIYVTLISLVVVGWADHVFRRGFNPAYLGLTIPLKRSEIPPSVNSLNPNLNRNEIFQLFDFRVRFDTSNSAIWMQFNKKLPMLSFQTEASQTQQMFNSRYIHKLEFNRATNKVTRVTTGVSAGGIVRDALGTLFLLQLIFLPLGDGSAKAGGSDYFIYSMAFIIAANYLLIAWRSAQKGCEALESLRVG